MSDRLQGRPRYIYRCDCGAMLSNERAMHRHLNGETMCQHRSLRRYIFDGQILFSDPFHTGESEGEETNG